MRVWFTDLFSNNWLFVSGGCVLISTVLLLVNFFVFIPEILLSRDEKEQGWKLENIYPTATLFYLPASLLSSFMAITATKQCATPTWICQVGYRSHTKDMLPNDPILLFWVICLKWGNSHTIYKMYSQHQKARSLNYRKRTDNFDSWL